MCLLAFVCISNYYAHICIVVACVCMYIQACIFLLHTFQKEYYICSSKHAHDYTYARYIAAESVKNNIIWESNGKYTGILCIHTHV